MSCAMEPRRGLVLGAGGVLGAAWTVGALCALEESLGVDLRTCDHILGTSAGSVLAALLGAGVTPAQLRDHQLGRVVDGPLSVLPWDYDHATGGALPPRPRWGVGSPALVRRNARRLRRLPPTAVISALLPVGRGSLDELATMVARLAPPDAWSDHPGVWIVTMDYETGRRVPFGRPGEPEASLAEAVTASCAIPGWYAPVAIGGHRYVDGGACSATSVDLFAGLGLDEVYVVAPMVSRQFDHPRSLLGRMERRWRAAVTRRCLHETQKLRAEGTRVTILGPSVEDLEAIGINVMQVSRRVTVLETSLRTSAAALAGGPAARQADAG
ncbi:MAG TPA: patatin-like phospholipase family protein [Jiangellaceae bacterium]|nr:patatin-like phospholipase family protein [Jiangellaceae bacterium]